jgi:predicted ATPase
MKKAVYERLEELIPVSNWSAIIYALRVNGYVIKQKKQKKDIERIEYERDCYEHLYKNEFVVLKQLYEYVLRYDVTNMSHTKDKLLIDVEKALNITPKIKESNDLFMRK